MAGSDSSGGEAKQLPKPETTLLTIKIRTRIPRRQLTLVSITICLNTLLWTSVFVFITSLYLIASDPDDTTNTPTEVLTITSSLVSIAYIVLHTIFSLKQRIWRHQGRHPSIVKKTSYVAVRFSVTLCILWLLTSGWNLITVARQPVCLPEAPGRQGWEAGTTCVVGRLGIALSLIALFAACTLFGLLATVRRPFEAHVFKHGYHHHRLPLNPTPTPGVSRRPSPSRSASSISEKYHRRRISISTHRSTPSNFSNTDVGTIDLNSNSPPNSTILAPSPIRTITTGIFTSHTQPPPLPAAFVPPRSASLDLPLQPPSRPPSAFIGAPLPIFHPSASYHHLPLPPRMSALVSPSGFIPLSIPAQYTASAWKAVHPPLPSPLGPSSTFSASASGSRSYTHLPLHHRASSGNLNSNSNSGYNFSYRSRYSRSSVSLTRPHRLSSTPASVSGAWSSTSRSASTGPGEEGRRSRSPPSNSASATVSGAGPGGANVIENANVRGIGDRPDANAIAYAILNGTKMPGHDIVHPKKRVGHSAAQAQSQTQSRPQVEQSGSVQGQGHVRRASAPADPISDTVSGAIGTRTRMELGWKPKPKVKPSPSVPQLQTLAQAEKGGKATIKRTSSADLLSRFSSTDSSPSSGNGNENGERNLRAEIERELDRRLLVQGQREVRKSSSQSTIRANPASAIRQVGEDTMAGSSREVGRKDIGKGKGKGEGEMKGRMTLDRDKFDLVKNKPLPKIALL